jgi:hypothetical protein
MTDDDHELKASGGPPGGPRPPHWPVVDKSSRSHRPGSPRHEDELWSNRVQLPVPYRGGLRKRLALALLVLAFVFLAIFVAVRVIV